ncbi:MAG: DUF4276 family protein [Taibaiella sp.]|nr:DUF4276 family protein [Taibaiella sp.]
MKKIMIICEGQSEQMFCDKILKPHFSALGITIEYPRIAHSGGGIVKWQNFKPEIELHYATDNDRFITTFIDYYGMYNHHKFPEWANAHVELVKSTRMEILEAGMLNDLTPDIGAKFIPYIQLHEFEALVFSDFVAFINYYSPIEFSATGLVNLAALCALDPETINDGIATAPSKRLSDNIPAYDKVTDGIELASLIGLNKIRCRCSRFDAWITRLEGI